MKSQKKHPNKVGMIPHYDSTIRHHNPHGLLSQHLLTFYFCCGIVMDLQWRMTAHYDELQSSSGLVAYLLTLFHHNPATKVKYQKISWCKTRRGLLFRIGHADVSHRISGGHLGVFMMTEPSCKSQCSIGEECFAINCTNYWTGAK